MNTPLPTFTFSQVWMLVTDVTIWRPVEWMLQKKPVVFTIALN